MSKLTFSVKNNGAEIIAASSTLWNNAYLYLDKDDNVSFVEGYDDVCYTEPLYYLINKFEHFIDCVTKGINNVSLKIDGYELLYYKNNQISIFPKSNKFIFNQDNIDLFNNTLNIIKQIVVWLKTL